MTDKAAPVARSADTAPVATPAAPAVIAGYNSASEIPKARRWST